MHYGIYGIVFGTLQVLNDLDDVYVRPALRKARTYFSKEYGEKRTKQDGAPCDRIATSFFEDVHVPCGPHASLYYTGNASLCSFVSKDVYTLVPLDSYYLPKQEGLCPAGNHIQRRAKVRLSKTPLLPLATTSD